MFELLTSRVLHFCHMQRLPRRCLSQCKKQQIGALSGQQKLMDSVDDRILNKGVYVYIITKVNKFALLKAQMLSALRG